MVVCAVPKWTWAQRFGAAELGNGTLEAAESCSRDAIWIPDFRIKDWRISSFARRSCEEILESVQHNDFILDRWTIPKWRCRSGLDSRFGAAKSCDRDFCTGHPHSSESRRSAHADFAGRSATRADE